MGLKVTVVTVVRNGARTLKDAMGSVLRQNYPDLEYIVVDGASTDGTLRIIKDYEPEFRGRLRWVSEPDKGLYDALNKGIRMATGDVVGIIHADDFYCCADVVEKVAEAFEDESLEVVFGDVGFVDPRDLKRTVRHYSARNFSPARFRFGFMPPHPTFFTRKRNFEKFGYYKTDYRIAADYELLIRFLHTYKLKYRHLPFDFMKMRTGGISTRSLKSNYILNQEIVRGCRENGIYTNMGILGMKYFLKVFELFPRGK